MTLIDQIRDMIAKGETEKSLNELYNYVRENNADIIDNLVMLRSRMQRLQSQKSNGTIDNEDEVIEQAKINEAILKLLPQLTPEYLVQANKISMPTTHQTPLSEKTSPPFARNKKMAYMLGGALGSILLVIIILVLVIPAESQAVNEDTLLYNAITNHAIWASTSEASKEQNIFRFENDKVCHEIVNDEIVHTFDVVNNDANSITLHDASRNIYLLIGKLDVQIKYKQEDTWNNLYTGAWVVPSEGE